jgi:ABC-type multidrug transport system permease subunit
MCIIRSKPSAIMQKGRLFLNTMKNQQTNISPMGQMLIYCIYSILIVPFSLIVFINKIFAHFAPNVSFIDLDYIK